MFQSFETTSERDRSAERVARLRETFADFGIDAFIVPHADEFQGEYLPASAERLAWLSGFTGSAGFAVVTRFAAHIFSDGRYTLQLKDQTDGAVWTRHTLPDAKIEDALQSDEPLWIGADPWLHTIRGMEKLTKTLKSNEIVRLPVNPIDLVWTDKPTPHSAPIVVHPIEYAGKLAKEKLSDAVEMIRKADARAHVVSDPLSFAWLFNLRGSDVAHNPVPLARAILRDTGRHIAFVDERRLKLSARSYLTQLADIAPERDFARTLAEVSSGHSILLDPDRAPDAMRGVIEWAGGKLVSGEDPALLPRARKNDTEIDGARSAHRRDGAAMVAFLAWLDGREAGTVTEIEAAETLERFRRETGERLGQPLREIAFDTISGAGPHGAIVHYRVTRNTDRVLDDGELYLCDSGGQYFDGTTDITRTVAIGTPPPKARKHFTLVLKGMIAISHLRFPKGTTGRQIDAIARTPQWMHGYDYGHGTGHGVGSYGAVHEGPQGISKRSSAEIEPGMILSNEPGHYREGEYGIRIENLVLALPAEPMGGDDEMMSFETLTLCPIDQRLIDVDLLDDAERAWLDDYHSRVEREIAPLLHDEQTRNWLQRACAPLDRAAQASAANLQAEASMLALDGAAPSLPERPQQNDRTGSQGDDGDKAEAHPGKDRDDEGQRFAPTDKQ